MCASDYTEIVSTFGMEPPAQPVQQPDMQPADQPRMEPCIQVRRQACSQACMQQGMDGSMDTDVQASVQVNLDLPTKNGRCPRGYSALQIVILSILKGSPQVIAYWQIAGLITNDYGLQTTAGAVRGALDRLHRRGLIFRNQSANGYIRGNRYAFAREPCQHIQVFSVSVKPVMEHGMEPSAQAHTQSVMHPGQNFTPSILKEKTDRKNLSISSENTEEQEIVKKLEALTEDDMAFHWPELSKLGFGTDQIRQILSRLAQVNIKAVRIMQGLTHAEWELVNDKMRDKNGFTISNPVSWVFKILANQGYYPRPDNYISPEEKAELDIAEEVKRMTAAHNEKIEAIFTAWVTALPLDKRKAILELEKGNYRMPDESVLRKYFNTEILPNLKAKNNREDEAV